MSSWFEAQVPDHVRELARTHFFVMINAQIEKPFAMSRSPGALAAYAAFLNRGMPSDMRFLMCATDVVDCGKVDRNKIIIPFSEGEGPRGEIVVRMRGLPPPPFEPLDDRVDPLVTAPFVVVSFVQRSGPTKRSRAAAAAAAPVVSPTQSIHNVHVFGSEEAVRRKAFASRGVAFRLSWVAFERRAVAESVSYSRTRGYVAMRRVDLRSIVRPYVADVPPMELSTLRDFRFPIRADSFYAWRAAMMPVRPVYVRVTFRPDGSTFGACVYGSIACAHDDDATFAGRPFAILQAAAAVHGPGGWSVDSTAHVVGVSRCDGRPGDATTPIDNDARVTIESDLELAVAVLGFGRERGFSVVAAHPIMLADREFAPPPGAHLVDDQAPPLTAKRGGINAAMLT